MTLAVIAGLMALLYVFALVHRRARKRWLRQQGIYPPPGQASVAHVERLLQAGYYLEAIMCYREVFPKAGLVEAKAGVDALKT
jgi:hypothetical protein